MATWDHEELKEKPMAKWDTDGIQQALKNIANRDQVNSPPHYGQGQIECIEYIEDFLTKEEYIGYLKGCKLKYDLRYPFKDHPEQDLEKSDWYKNKLLEATKDEVAVNPPEIDAQLQRIEMADD